MAEEVVLITYSEIGLKSPPVRRALELRLAHHIEASLKRVGVANFRVRRMQGRLLVETGNPEAAAEAASHVFGVASAIPAVKAASDVNSVMGATLEVATQNIKDGQTFAVRARRVGEQAYTSRDLEVRAGAEILRELKVRGVGVNLESPDVTIHMEVRGGEAYIYHRIISGPSGLPFGSQGRVVGLFSGGIDSPVAAWFMMKRGADVKLLFLDQRPFVGDDYYGRALKVAERLRQYVPSKSLVLHVALMGEIMDEIVEHVSAKFTCVVCKRMMYRVACGLGERVNADGIVTGESLGQVASQTLANLKVLSGASTLPVYRPLIGFEKMEIVAWAKKIGTYEASTTRIHGCSAVPAKPSTKAKAEDILEAERSLPIEELVSDALKRATQIKI